MTHVTCALAASYAYRRAIFGFGLYGGEDMLSHLSFSLRRGTKASSYEDSWYVCHPPECFVIDLIIL